jgi:uncharacterized radical SAM superfamily Fe-S cluster-containing enzyme
MTEAKKVIHLTESVCPVCLRKIPARHVLQSGNIYMEKTCENHGDFSTIIWRGEGKPDYYSWKKNKVRSQPQKCLSKVEKGCPYDCGLCPDHRQQTCCVLLEVTERCNLNCNVCYANSRKKASDPSFETIKKWLKHLADAGKPFIHLSGGEPTVRDDLPEIIKMAKDMGFPYIQLNTNGLRLAQDPEYVKALKESGLSSVFMQFDGTRAEIYRRLRGRDLLGIKVKAIENCGNNKLGVVLVPTIVPGVNSGNIGEIVRFGMSKIPDVRGIHFQPVSYFGRYPDPPRDEQRITLPEIIREIENQTESLIQVEDFAPSGCDHARCGFHGSFVLMPDGSVKKLTPSSNNTCCTGERNISPVEKNQNFVSRRWVREDEEENQIRAEHETDGFDYFIKRIKTYGFTITGMAFQDCWNLDLERLSECSLHVLSPDGRIIPFCAYNLSSAEGKTLYRGHVQRFSFFEAEKKTEGCLVCGKELIYGESASTELCQVCGKEYETYIKCPEGHYICSLCHSMDVLGRVEQVIAGSAETNPMKLIKKIFNLSGLNMHGPEYHSIVPAVLVAAFQNLSGKKDRTLIREAIKRGSYLAGGSCGYYGVCGACVGTGIAFSIINNVTPLSLEKRGEANILTGRALLEISKFGGPRCCKREAITSIKTFMKNTAYFKSIDDAEYICNQHQKNKECLGKKCPYYGT